MLPLLLHLFVLFVALAAGENDKIIEILQDRDVARCFRSKNVALLGEDVCYVPNVCPSRNGTISLSEKSIRRLIKDNTFEIFQNIWNYGSSVELRDTIPHTNDRRIVFISVDLQGASHFAANVALPVVRLLERFDS